MTDLRLALRTLRATPIVTAAAVLSLALGIGANTAIFSLVNGLLLRPLPVARPDLLVGVATGNEPVERSNFSYATFDQIRRHADAFDGALAFSNCCGQSSVTVGSERWSADRFFVSGDFFSTLGLTPAAGRFFTPTDDVAGGGAGGPAVVIGYRLWRERFGGRADVAGTAIVGVREHRRPAAGARRGPPSRAERSDRARRVASAAGPADARRKRAARGRRDALRPRSRGLGEPRDRRADVVAGRTARPRPSDGLARARLYSRSHDRRRPDFRDRSGAAGGRRRADRRAEGTRSWRRRRQPTLDRGARAVAGRALARAHRRRRPVRGDVRATRTRVAWIRPPPDDRDHADGANGAGDRTKPVLSPPRPRAGRGAWRCARRRFVESAARRLAARRRRAHPRRRTAAARRAGRHAGCGHHTGLARRVRNRDPRRARLRRSRHGRFAAGDAGQRSSGSPDVSRRASRRHAASADVSLRRVRRHSDRREDGRRHR